MRASHILPTQYLHDTSITPHPSHRGRRGQSRPTDGSCTCWPHTTYLLPYTLVVPVTHYLAPTRPTEGGRGKVDPTSIISVLATCQLYPTQSLQHTAYIRTMTIRGKGGCRAEPYIYIRHVITYLCYTQRYMLDLNPSGFKVSRGKKRLVNHPSNCSFSIGKAHRRERHRNWNVAWKMVEV